MTKITLTPPSTNYAELVKELKSKRFIKELLSTANIQTDAYMIALGVNDMSNVTLDNN